MQGSGVDSELKERDSHRVRRRHPVRVVQVAGFVHDGLGVRAHRRAWVLRDEVVAQPRDHGSCGVETLVGP